MKNLIVITILFFAANLIAQEPEKDVKSADKKYGLYNLDTKGNAAKLWEAKALIDEASKNPSSNHGEIRSKVKFCKLWS